jgi:hypothetical protein
MWRRTSLHSVETLSAASKGTSCTVTITSNLRFGERLAAAAIHLLLSVFAAAIVLAVVFLGWYPSPLDRLVGVGTVLLMMLGVDVVLGPLCTAIVFDRSKKGLKTDLAVIASIQIAALLFGVWTVHQGRPAWIVFAKDRFELVAPAEVAQPYRDSAADNASARMGWLRPRYVAAQLPFSEQERSRILLDSIATGRDIQHIPTLYGPYALQAREAVDRSLPISRLRALNPDRSAEITALLQRVGRPESQLRYLPIGGPASDGVAVIDAVDGKVLAIAALVPW